MTTLDAPAPAPAAPLHGLRGIDHLEWWVGNARAFTAYLASAYGFHVVARCGPETGHRDRVSYVVEQGAIRFVVTAALDPDAPIAAHVREHGDGVRDVAFAVDDVPRAHAACVERGARSAAAPVSVDDVDGTVVSAAVDAYGETRHSLVDRSGYHGAHAPGFAPADLADPVGPKVGLGHIDHVVANVAEGDLDEWVHWYERTFGFERLVHFDEEAISTEFSALRSTVVWDGSSIVLPINEPAPGRRKSQIEEYLDYYRAPGVQHIAMHTDDIVATVQALRMRGVRFLAVPPAYYDDARTRMEGIDLPWSDLARLGILVDRDDDGHLLQVFTEAVGDRPTVFFEVIQRVGARGFGEGNFKALFEAIEREQARRGNL